MANSRVEQELKKHAWYRILQVIRVGAYLFVGLLAVACLYESNVTELEANTQSSTITCPGGSVNTFASLGIQATDYLQYYAPSDLDYNAQQIASQACDGGSYTVNARTVPYRPNANEANDALWVVLIGFFVIELTRAAIIYIARGGSTTHRGSSDE